jgi:hypothetical protein
LSRFILDASVTLCWCFENDAAYLGLALREGLPLATMHNNLRKAVHAAGVKIAGTE